MNLVGWTRKAAFFWEEEFGRPLLMSSESQIEGKRETVFSKLGRIQMELCNCYRRGLKSCHWDWSFSLYDVIHMMSSASPV